MKIANSGRRPRSEGQMKGLRRLDVAVTDVTPCYVPVPAVEKLPDTFKPAKLPIKAKTEMSQEERHSAHLRKRRQAKAARKTEDRRLHVMAKFDPKVKDKLERGKVMSGLAENRNVTIIGHTGVKKNGVRVPAASEKKGKRWKHNLTETLLNKR